MPSLSITVTRSPDGTVSVAGPLHDLGICYMLLELGRDAVREHHDKASASPIIAATTLPPGLGG